MSDRHIELESESATDPDSEFVTHTRAVLKVLGVTRSRQRLDSTIDIHDLVLKGLPHRSLKKLQTETGLSQTILAHAVQISPRSYQRLAAECSSTTLTAALSSNLWQFADIYTRAVMVMGTQALATQWLNSETLALNDRKPIDLLSTRQGAGMVSELLTRLDYGVYT